MHTLPCIQNYRWFICVNYNILEKFKETKQVIRSRKSKKDRQYNDQKKKDNRTNNDLQNTVQKTKDRVTRTSLKRGFNSVAPEG